jgi:hypothetical protein
MPTVGDLLDEVEAELDVADEDFVERDELLVYLKRAINKAESLILNLNEDYFLAEPAEITLASGTASYSLPADIYGQKIRLVQYDNGNDDYQIKRLKNLADIPRIEDNDNYQYLITSDYTNGTKLRLYPTPAENGAVVTLWYLRNVDLPDADDDTLDLPEAYDFCKQFVKDMVANKENMAAGAGPSPALLAEQELLIASLHQRFVDEQVVTAEEVNSFIDEVN